MGYFVVMFLCFFLLIRLVNNIKMNIILFIYFLGIEIDNE